MYLRHHHDKTISEPAEQQHGEECADPGIGDVAVTAYRIDFETGQAHAERAERRAKYHAAEQTFGQFDFMQAGQREQHADHGKNRDARDHGLALDRLAAERATDAAPDHPRHDRQHDEILGQVGRHGHRR